MRPDEGFDDHKVTIVEGIASLAALAIDNARLYEAEHHVALTLQRALLAMPQEVEGISFAHAYRSASEEAFVGGDFYDIFQIESGLIGLLVGDIAGKGLEAALLTQLVKNTVRTTSVIRRSNGPTVELPADSPLLGAFADRIFAQSEVHMAPHDLLFLFTDGITEARSGSRQFGDARLLRVIGRLSPPEPTAAVIAIVNEVLGFTGGSLSDDLAVLVVERLGEQTETCPPRRLEADAHV